MSNEAYRKALKAAERELLQLIRVRASTERKVAQTRQTVLTLRMKLAADTPYLIHPDSYIPKTLTDACRNAIFGARLPLGAHDVLDRVEAAGFEIKAVNKLASVYSVLKRLTEQGAILPVYRTVGDSDRPMLLVRAYWANSEGYPPPSGWRVFSPAEIKKELALMKKIGIVKLNEELK